MLTKWRGFLANEAGGVAIPFALSITMLLGVAAIVIDLGHAYVVKRELQTAADAGATAGALGLSQNSGNPEDGTLNFANGKTVATTAVRRNYANGVLLSDFNSDNSATKVQSGYWDTTWTAATAPANLNGYADPASYVPSATECAAVKVVIAKTAGGTGSAAPVSTFFASTLGISSMAMQAQSVAILLRNDKTGPQTVPPDTCFPLATPETWVKNHFKTDPPVSFRIGSAYHSDDGGDWTSFLLNANDAKTIDNLIDRGNPDPLSIGQNIWIEPGVKNSVYNYASELVGKTMLMAVVGDTFDTNSSTPIKAFAAFYFEAANNGSNPYIQGHFVNNFIVKDAVPGGANYGAVTGGGQVKLVN